MKKTIYILIYFLLIKSTPLLANNSVDHLYKVITKREKHFPQGNLSDINFVKNLIHYMYQTDQDIRKEAFSNLNDIEVIKLIKKMDEFHTTKMKEILLLYKWINISRFGKEADHEAWLLIQHADEDPFFQAGCLFVLSKLIDQDETDKKNYTYLYDRVALKFQNFNIKQRYGTQVRMEKSDPITLLPYEGTLEDIDKKRKEIGLEPLEEYFQTIKKFYHDNKN